MKNINGKSLNIEFVCNEDMIARFWFCNRRGMELDFANYLWGKYPESYKILKMFPLNDRIDPMILDEVKSQPFFKKLIIEALESKKEIQSNFNQNKAKIEDLLFNRLKIDFNVPDGKCFCMPREYYAGNSFANENENIFVYGSPQGKTDTEYDAVYVLHEDLHSLFGGNPFEHSVLQLIADFETGIALRGSPYEGHWQLKTPMRELLPYWNLFVGRNKEEIAQVCELCGFDYNLDEYEKYRTELEKMKFSKFYKWLEKTQKEKEIYQKDK